MLKIIIVALLSLTLAGCASTRADCDSQASLLVVSDDGQAHEFHARISIDNEMVFEANDTVNSDAPSKAYFDIPLKPGALSLQVSTNASTSSREAEVACTAPAMSAAFRGDQTFLGITFPDA